MLKSNVLKSKTTVLKKLPIWQKGRGVKNSEKLPTSFMDGPISNDLDPVPWSLSKKKTKAKKVYEERRQV